MIRTLIVDDEAPARERLKRLLAPHPDIEVIGEAGDGASALERIAALAPDLVFLDIQMPELDGLGVAQALSSPAPHIIFATAFDDHALSAFEAAAVDYLVKPINAARLSKALDKIRARRGPDIQELLDRLATPQTKDRVAFKSGARYLVAQSSEITAIVAEDRYAVVKGPEEEILCDESLDALALRLGSSFMRIHRKAIVNINRVTSLDREGDRKYFAIIKDKEDLRIPVSRERIADIKKALGVS